MREKLKNMSDHAFLLLIALLEFIKYDDTNSNLSKELSKVEILDCMNYCTEDDYKKYSFVRVLKDGDIVECLEDVIEIACNEVLDFLKEG